MSKVKVWLGGEGSSEIGDRDRPGGERIGAIEALLRRLEPDGWLVAGATIWKRIRKFTRDVDADRARADAIIRGVEFAQTTFPSVAIIGGPAIPAIEGWILALVAVRDTEDMSRERANRELDALDLGGKHAEAYVAVIEQADLGALPPGSDALGAWIERARGALGAALRGAASP